MNRRISDPQTPRRGPGPEGAGDEASDEELARRFVATADHGTFVALVERHLPAVRRLLAGLFNGVAEDIEDAQQEILATLYVGMDRFRFQSSFRTYFYRLCRNTAIDMLRRKGRERRRVEAAAREAQALAGVAAEAGFDPDRGLVRDERRQALRDALAALDPEERMLVIMKDSEGMPVEEMSRVLSIPEGTVKSRLHRTREKLARLMGGEYDK